MIFYFSGTGNSAWVARQLAHLTGDVACDITTLAHTPDVQKEEQVGFVFPVYAWGASEVMTNFASKLARPQAFAFGVCTCGSEAGLTMKRFAKECPLDSSYSLVMPNNYIIGSDTDSDAVIQEKIASARKALQQIAQEILHRQRVDRVHEGALAGVKSRMANFGFNRFARTTKPFFVTDRCNGCGTCARDCPASAISLKDGKPQWQAQCYQCMRCINACPTQAIQYGKSTEGRRRYTIEAHIPQEERR